MHTHVAKPAMPQHSLLLPKGDNVMWNEEECVPIKAGYYVNKGGASVR